MVEDKSAVVYIKKEADEKHDADSPLDMMSDDVIVLKQKPITSSIRGTIAHITAQAGSQARWRGLSAFVVYNLAFSLVDHGFLTAFVSLNEALGGVAVLNNAFAVLSLSFFFTTVVLARLHMTITHIIISEPSEKPWYRRVLSLHAARKIRGPAAMVAICRQLTLGLPVLFFFLLQLDKTTNVQALDSCVAMKVLAMFAIGLLTAIGLLVPATVALARCEASMLPEEYETIVPFDRTFGGKVVPEVLGGTGRVGYFDAWASFSGDSRIRLMGLFAKILFIDVLMHVFYVSAFVINAWLIFGDGMQPLLVSTHAQITGNTLPI